MLSVFELLMLAGNVKLYCMPLKFTVKKNAAKYTILER